MSLIPMVHQEKVVVVLLVIDFGGWIWILRLSKVTQLPCQVRLILAVAC